MWRRLPLRTADRGESQLWRARHQTVVDAEQLALQRAVHDVQRGHRALRGEQRAERTGVIDHRVDVGERVQPAQHVPPLVGGHPDLGW